MLWTWQYHQMDKEMKLWCGETAGRRHAVERVSSRQLAASSQLPGTTRPDRHVTPAVSGAQHCRQTVVWGPTYGWSAANAPRMRAAFGMRFLPRGAPHRRGPRGKEFQRRPQLRRGASVRHRSIPQPGANVQYRGRSILSTVILLALERSSAVHRYRSTGAPRSS